MAYSVQDAGTHYWYADDAQRERSVAVLEAMRGYLAAEAAMRGRTQRVMGLGENDLLALRYLLTAQLDGRSIGPKDLTGYLGISSASTTALIDRLEKAGQVRREHSPTDRRALILVPTARTDDEIQAALGDAPARMAEVARRLNPSETEVVSGFLRDMRVAVDEIDAYVGSEAPPRPIIVPMSAASWPGPDASNEGDEVITRLLEYRHAEEAMRRRTRDSMRMGTTDLQALRFLIKAQTEQRIVSGRDLADHLGMTSASVSALLDRLTKGGHVQRTPHPTNRRSNMVTASPGSDEVVRQTLGAMHSRMIDTVRALSAADAALIEQFLTSMTAAVDSVDSDGAA